jgi:uncharacterized protein
MIGPAELTKPLSPKEFAELSDFLSSEATPEKTMPLPMLDGFLTAILSGPVLILPSTWLPAIWSEDEEDAPTFASEKQAQRIMGLILRHNNAVSASLQEMRVSPFFLTLPEKDQYAGADAWSYGYVTGMGMAMEAWQPISEDEHGAQFLLPLLAPAAPPDFFEEKPSEEMLARMISSIPVAAIGVYAFWRLRQNPAELRASLPRNRSQKRNPHRRSIASKSP